MTQYLRKHGTDEVFVWTEQLAERPDMVPHEQPPTKVEAKQKEDANSEKDGLGSFIPDPLSLMETSGDDQLMPDANKITAIVEAISMLEPEDFTKDGKPTIKSLERVLGFAPTKEERDAAVEAAKTVVNDLPVGTGTDDAQE